MNPSRLEILTLMDSKYLFRDYRADSGRWPSRDPIGIGGGVNVHVVVANQPTIFVDVQGGGMMKTIRVLLLVALGWLALPASVWAFYNPSTGRWLSRDPVAEESAFRRYVHLLPKSEQVRMEDDRYQFESNEYIFCNNSCPSMIDLDGARMTPTGDIAITDKNRRTPPTGMILVEVPKCTILFVYGHNYVNNFEKTGLQQVWNIVPKRDEEAKCSYAVVGGCSANLIPNEIPLPGFNYANYDPGDEGMITGAVLLNMWRDLYQKYGPAAADSCCKACGCKEIKITHRLIGKGEFLPKLKDPKPIPCAKNPSPK